MTGLRGTGPGRSGPSRPPAVTAPLILEGGRGTAEAGGAYG